MTIRNYIMTSLTFLGLVLISAEPSFAGEESLFESSLWIDSWKIINFLILAGLIYKVAKEPASAFFKSKKKESEELLEEIEQARDKAQAELDDLKAKLANADQEITEIVEQLKALAARNREKIIQETKKQAEDIIEQAKASAENELVRAKQRLISESSGSVIEKASLILQSKLSDDDHERLIEEALSGMDSTKIH